MVGLMDDGVRRQELLELRRPGWRDAVRVGVAGARTMHVEARGRLQADGTRRRRLHRTRAMNLPGPLRLYALMVVNVVSIRAMPFWVGRTADDEGAVGAWPVNASGRLRRWKRMLPVVALVDVPALVAIGWVRLDLGPASIAFAAVVGLAALPVLWPIVTGLREWPSTRPLRRAQRAISRQAAGPLFYAAGLSSGGRGGGRALVAALVRRADFEGITLIGRTEAGPLVKLYDGAGFEVAAIAPTWWGTAVLVVRHPRPSGADDSAGIILDDRHRRKAGATSAGGSGR